MKHILIDYENIQPKSFDAIETDECHIWLFLGINQQKSLPLELVETLLSFDSKNVHIIKMQHTGKNALDFYLSFYLGKISEIDSCANVCILARDSGYDVLVEHLNSVYDGIDIIRAADTNQLNLNYLLEDVIDTDIEHNPLSIQDSQNILYNCAPRSDSHLLIKNDDTLIQSVEDNISKAVIHDCYVLVFDSIINREMFLPTYKSNLLSAIKKYALAKELEDFDAAEQDYIVGKVFDKFIKIGLIRLNTESGKLSYKTDSQGILGLVTEKVLLSKAKTVEGLNNVIKQKLANYRQLNNEEQVNLVIKYLKKEGLIKQSNQTISYPTLGSIEIKKSENGAKSKSSNTIYQRAIVLIKDRPISSRPSKKSTLINYLKNHLRNDDSKAVENLVNQMVNNKLIVVSDNNKLSYKV